MDIYYIDTRGKYESKRYNSDNNSPDIYSITVYICENGKTDRHR